MTFEQTETAEFIDTPIFFVRESPGGVWLIPAPIIGYALRAKSNGLEFERRHWARALKELGGVLAEDIFLAELRMAYSETALGIDIPLAVKTLIFNPSGLVKALTASRAALAIKFRRFLYKHFHDVFSPEELKLLLPKNKNTPKKEVKHVSTKKTAKPAQKTTITLPDLPNLPKELAAPLTVLREMASTGYFKEETLAELYLDLFKRSLREADAMTASRQELPPGRSLDPLVYGGRVEDQPKKDATEMVPVSNIQASSLTPNFQSVRSFFLTGSQKHPLFKDWIPAEAIASRFGRNADWAKKFISEYVASKGKDLPNNVATEKVVRNGGWFQGVSTLVDAFQLPTYVDKDLGGLACWYLMQDGKLVWRNYWSPEAVFSIVQFMPANLPLPEGKQTDLVIETVPTPTLDYQGNTGEGLTPAVPPNGQY